MDERTLLIWGAGKIGRSFIGQIFGRGGFRVVFVDSDRRLVQELNRRQEYTVVIKKPSKAEAERIVIPGVSALHISQSSAICESLVRADLAAISVGKEALSIVAPQISPGLVERERRRPGAVLDVILAENMRDASAFFREILRRELPSGYPLDQRVGLVETSIGKMVPLMTRKDLEKDPLQVFAEPYNTLILDRKGFLGPLPDLPDLALKENMKAWVDRKSFIHNLGHATAAYAGFARSPDAVYLPDVLDDPEVLGFTRKVMQQAATILLAAHPAEFHPSDLESHIGNLLDRFRNRNLGDTLFRVGSDLRRKLGAGDRFMAPLRSALSTGTPYAKILDAMALGFSFRATDEQGHPHSDDRAFRSAFRKDPEGTLGSVCGLSRRSDREVVDLLLHKIRHPLFTHA